MAHIQLTRLSILDNSIINACKRVLALKTDNIDQHEEGFRFVRRLKEYRTVLIDTIKSQVVAYSGDIQSPEQNIVRTFAVPQDETDFNTMLGTWLTDTITFFDADPTNSIDEERLRWEEIGITVKTAPDPADVTLLNDIFDITVNP